MIKMTAVLSDVLETLRIHGSELRRFGVSHAAVFGSVARGKAGAASDIDVLVELDEEPASARIDKRFMPLFAPWRLLMRFQLLRHQKRRRVW